MNGNELISSLIGVFLLIVFYFFFRRPRETPWYSSSTEAMGKYGESLIYDVLEPLEKYGFKFLFNLYVPRGDDRRKTTEIDVVMIGRCGVFIIESKNYSGWIFGNEKNRYWTQIIYRRKHRFYNPILQNRNHIRWIRKFIGYNTPIHSVIVFSDRCTFKNITYESPEVAVVHRKELRQTVSDIIRNKSTSRVSPEKIQEIYDKLAPFENASSEVRSNHIANIENGN